ncbi:MAG: SUMF1/EgtB/PvdO family nonheme iron enzyme [Candidatus Zhuqueibacterota bacterium]
MPDSTQPATPKVFISSTVGDLTEFRTAVRDAALRIEFLPVMSEYFLASGARPPLDECLAKVDACDVLVVIVAHRFGWIPEKQPGKERKSITWLECERARMNGTEILAFLADEKMEWDEKKKESYRLVEAANSGTLTPALSEDVLQAMNELDVFKAWLNKNYVRDTFTNFSDLAAKVSPALSDWRERHRAQFPVTTVTSDPTRYLQWIYDECSTIPIRGLAVGSGKVHTFGIEELYIPLKTAGEQKERGSDKKTMAPDVAPRKVELHETLTHKYLTIIGDPGAGKTTFLRRIAFHASRALLHLPLPVTAKAFTPGRDDFPIFIRLGELTEYIIRCRKRNDCAHPVAADDPEWILQFLADRSQSKSWGLSREHFKQKFQSGDTIFLLDGLDEAPDRITRESMCRLVESCMRDYPGCSFVVTSRPGAYRDNAVLQNFYHVTIEPLEDSSIQTFLRRWSDALFPGSPAQAGDHYNDLNGALQSRIEIRRMARNPVMLTALAVVHWNESRLPEQRADLYESVITWLLRSREQRPGRLSAEQCGARLQNLALAMQNHPEGRKVSVGRRWAAEAIKDDFPGKTKEQKIAAAETFLSEEEVDSGIVVGRGNNITFWHLTFQEYLAAKALGGKSDETQKSLLVNRKILHDPDWREVLLLFAGVLYGQGVDKVDNFFRAILDKVEENKDLGSRARCVGIIGGMLRDLSPFKYEIKDPRFKKMLNNVMAIFDKEKARNIDVKTRLEAADALGQAGDPRLNETDWVKIPAGSFLMGAQKENKAKPNYNESAQEWESPVHEVKLSAFKISRYLVTVGQYRQFVENDGYQNRAYWTNGGWEQFTEPKDWEQQLVFPSRPVVGVSWYEASAFAAWAKVKLPTEAQWERAAQGKSGKYHKYPWGDAEPDGKISNSGHTKLGHPSPVGLFPDDCTEEGVLDMGGNVWEWCRDWFDDTGFYEKSTGFLNPLNDEDGSPGAFGKKEGRVVRGGSWDFDNEYVFRCALRIRYLPEYRYLSLGFRVVCSAE